jgi:hypothetical protein
MKCFQKVSRNLRYIGDGFYNAVSRDAINDDQHRLVDQVLQPPAGNPRVNIAYLLRLESD